MTDTQKRLYSTARDQIEHNLDLLAPGISYAEFNAKKLANSRCPRRLSLLPGVTRHGHG